MITRVGEILGKRQLHILLGKNNWCHLSESQWVEMNQNPFNKKRNHLWLNNSQSRNQKKWLLQYFVLKFHENNVYVCLQNLSPKIVGYKIHIDKNVAGLCSNTPHPIPFLPRDSTWSICMFIFISMLSYFTVSGIIHEMCAAESRSASLSHPSLSCLPPFIPTVKSSYQ